VLDGAPAALGDGGAHDRIEPIGRHDEAALESRGTRRDRPLAREQPFDLRQVASLGLPTVIVMEGGYAVDALGANVAAFLSGF
jgi:hypothetical protein